jgi:hypothetical protein
MISTNTQCLKKNKKQSTNGSVVPDSRTEDRRQQLTAVLTVFPFLNMKQTTFARQTRQRQLPNGPDSAIYR